MDLIEFLVIYLACGAPFGVYQATSRQTARIASLWAFLFWPAFAIKLLANRLANRSSSTENRVDAIRIEIERNAFPNTDTEALFDFREIFDRFVGLAEHMHADRRSSGSGSSGKTLQTRCLERRNRNRIARHYMQAREEFIDAIGAMSAENDLLTSLASELSEHLGDPIPAVEFKINHDLAFPTVRKTPAAFQPVS